MATAICLARSGCQVTVLEAAAELGEIGAGIQMTPNVSRLLLRWGVADIIGENLVEPQCARMRKKNGEVVGYIELTPGTREYLGFPVSERARFLGFPCLFCIGTGSSSLLANTLFLNYQFLMIVGSFLKSYYGIIIDGHEIETLR